MMLTMMNKLLTLLLGKSMEYLLEAMTMKKIMSLLLLTYDTLKAWHSNTATIKVEKRKARKLSVKQLIRDEVVYNTPRIDTVTFSNQQFEEIEKKWNELTSFDLETMMLTEAAKTRALSKFRAPAPKSKIRRLIHMKRDRRAIRKGTRTKYIGETAKRERRRKQLHFIFWG